MTVSRPTLSIVIAARNQLNSLKFTLLTLRDQPPESAYEIIVVDCGSGDDSAHFLAAQMDKKLLRVITEEPTLGRSAARNCGAHAALGKYLMFLDPGVVLGPRWSESLLKTLDRDPIVGAVGGKIILPDGLIDHAGLAVLELATERGPRLVGRSIHAGLAGDAEGSLRALNVQGLAGEAMMVRATAFYGVDGFDEGLGRDFKQPKAMAEGEPSGLDLSLRLGERGWTRVYRHQSVATRLRVPEATVETSEVNSRRNAADDNALVSANWLGQVRPDFMVSTDGRVSPAETGFIRPYFTPQIAFRDKLYGDSLHPGHGFQAKAHSEVKASVIVLTFNALSFTRQCAASLLAHTDSRHEIIFVDNGSTDGTVDFLRELASAHDQVKTITNADNLGFAAGNNVGLAAATGRHMVLLNSDTVVTNGWLECLIQAAEDNPRAGLIGPVTNNISGLQKLSAVGYDQESLAGLEEFAARQTREFKGRADQTLRITGFCLLIKREVLARIGGLAEVFGIGNYEDNDYCLRAHLAGFECLIARDCFIHHFGSASFEAAGVDYVTQIHQQWDIFKNKWGIPAETPFNAQIDLSTLLARGFDAAEHFQALPLDLESSEEVRDFITAEG
ncbi:MAG: GT2 family glycosyltransferase [Candidatus Krumholzibacteriia bacterium]|jgi:GT2 family glycosyltransferase